MAPAELMDVVFILNWGWIDYKAFLEEAPAQLVEDTFTFLRKRAAIQREAAK